MTTEYGDRQAAMAGEILRTVVGSGVHGIAIEGTDDHDEMGIYIPAAATLLGIQPATEHYVHRTQPEGVRSGPGDTDLVMYALRKYLRLAIKGNPTALLPLFAPDESVLAITDLGRELRLLAPFVTSQQSVHRFLGYMAEQRKRMLGQSKRHVPNRPELVEAHGFDVKYASHALRLAYQGLEVAHTGHLTLPMPDQLRGHVLAVKRGEIPLDDVLGAIDRLAGEISTVLARGTTPLRTDPDLDHVSDWCVHAHQRFWGADR